MLALTSLSYAQKLPSSIRGYKVHQAEVRVRTPDDKTGGDKDAMVKVGVPRVVEVGLDGVVLEATAEISGFDQDGQVDSLMFKDVAVNGVPLRIEDYQHTFKLKKGTLVTLPFPIRGSVTKVNAAKAVYNEATASRDVWQVSGTVFVFGGFKKMGFTFKRVIPISITLTIPNPLKALATPAAHR